MTSEPKTRCAESGGISIAYHVIGDGPRDLRRERRLFAVDGAE